MLIWMLVEKCIFLYSLLEILVQPVYTMVSGNQIFKKVAGVGADACEAQTTPWESLH